MVDEYASDFAIVGYRSRFRLEQCTKCAIGENTMHDKHLYVIEEQMREHDSKSRGISSVARIDSADVNVGGVCLFCNNEFSGIWNDSSGCVCQQCNSMKVPLR